VSVSSVEKGNQLEDAFHSFLCEQLDRGDLVYGVHAAQTCTIHKRKDYYCKVREADVNFDIVVEVTGKGREKPHSILVFECKNYKSAVPETAVTDFSHKLERIFGHSAKGVLVYSSRLKSGAEAVSRNTGIGLAKFDEHGLEIKADRRNTSFSESRFIERQFFENQEKAKSLKFSAYFEGKYLSSVSHLLQKIDPNSAGEDTSISAEESDRVPFLLDERLQDFAGKLLGEIGYEGGPVDLEKICSFLSLDLSHSDQTVFDSSGETILGSANFESRTVTINFHKNMQRARFTIGHEIGHFYLGHDKYLRSESVLERDLFDNDERGEAFNEVRIECQANRFASNLLLPQRHFAKTTYEFRNSLGLQDRGHGYIFVDDQPCNYGPFNQLLTLLSQHFDVSKRAIEIELVRKGWLTDQRRRHVRQ